ncbi:MAG: DUF924 domain-containing protein [Bauldia sp.]|nr:DUF924 domain-containing protein [Bauldia sp.]
MVKKVLTDIHRHWFGELKSPTDVPADRTDMWFRPTAEIDNHIRDTFGKYLAAAKATEWDLDNLARMEQVALVILLDQFPRHIHRDSGDAFAYDAKALSIARRLVAGGIERFYRAERTFVLLPFEHSEDIADQDYSTLLFAAETVAAPAAVKEGGRAALDYATKHRDIIRKFGRFPHRNAALGRESTPEEIEFLKSGRGF